MWKLTTGESSKKGPRPHVQRVSGVGCLEEVVLAGSQLGSAYLCLLPIEFQLMIIENLKTISTFVARVPNYNIYLSNKV